MTRMATSGMKMPKQVSCLWEVCTQLRWMSSVHTETIAPFTINAIMDWKFFLRYRLASQISSHCRERHYIHGSLIVVFSLVKGSFMGWDASLMMSHTLTCLMIQNVLWVSKRSFTTGLVGLPECVWYGEMGESIKHIFFHCSVICPLCELIEGYMVCMMHGKFFFLDASSVCSNANLLLDRRRHYVFLCFLAVMWMVVWMTRMDEVHGALPFSSHWLHSFGTSWSSRSGWWERDFLPRTLLKVGWLLHKWCE